MAELDKTQISIGAGPLGVSIHCEACKKSIFVDEYEDRTLAQITELSEKHWAEIHGHSSSR